MWCLLTACKLTEGPAELGAIALLGPRTGVGGPTSFTVRMTQSLRSSGFHVSHSAARGEIGAVLIVSATGRLLELAGAKRRGARVVQRLDGRNWRHRVEPSSFRKRIRAPLLNGLVEGTARLLADHLVFQSEFAATVWRRLAGSSMPSSVIYNGVDLEIYRPEAVRGPIGGRVCKVMCVEGVWESDRATTSIISGLAAGLADRGVSAQIHICGSVAPPMARVLSRFQNVRIEGVLTPEELLAQLQRADVLVSAEINPACPNTVIEGLAVGLPVVAFDTGSLPELVKGGAGVLLPYGADPWQLHPPRAPERLADAVVSVLDELPARQAAAREYACLRFSLREQMARYLKVLLGS